MNIKRARELLVGAAKGLKDDVRPLEEAAMTFARVKQRNANRRDRWKVRKRLTISRESPDGNEIGKDIGENPPLSRSGM